MKLNIIDNGKEKGQVELPAQFNEPVRKDLIKRAVLALQNNRRQSYGAHPEAGKRASGKLSRRRRDYKGSYGHGISRVPRKTLSRRGMRFHWVGAVAPGTVKGRRAHPPKSDKVWEQKVNKKENRKAIRSAISATIIKDLVIERGHKVPDNYPFAVDSNIEGISKAKEVYKLLESLGFGQELERAAIKKIRAGKGKARGRKYKRKAGPLIVVSENCALIKACAGIPGVMVAKANELNAEMLAPGAMPGRATIWSQKAITKIGEMFK